MNLKKHGLKLPTSPHERNIHDIHGLPIATILTAQIKNFTEEVAARDRIIECVNAMVGKKPSEFIAENAAYRFSCESWESMARKNLMASTPEAAENVITQLINESNLRNDKLSDARDRVCNLTEQLDEMTATRDQLSNVHGAITAERDTLLEERKSLHIELDTCKSKIEGDKWHAYGLQHSIDVMKIRHADILSGDYFETSDLLMIFICRMQTKLTRMRDRIASAFTFIKSKFA